MNFRFLSFVYIFLFPTVTCLCDPEFLCSYADIDQMFDSEPYSDISLPSQISSHTSDGSMFVSFSESSYNSDHGSGNEDARDPSYVLYEESSDEVDFLTG